MNREEGNKDAKLPWFERIFLAVVIALLLAAMVIVATMPGFIDEETVPAGFSRFGR